MSANVKVPDLNRKVTVSKCTSADKEAGAIAKATSLSCISKRVNVCSNVC